MKGSILETKRSLEDVLDKINGALQFQMDEGIDVHTRGIFGDTPLHLASYWGDVEAVKILIANGAEIDPKGDAGMTPLCRAVEGDRPDVVDILLAARADPYLEDIDGGDVFVCAELLKRTECLKRLQKAKKEQ